MAESMSEIGAFARLQVPKSADPRKTTGRSVRRGNIPHVAMTGGTALGVLLINGSSC